MTVEQTSQLIQLILNSGLLVAICSVLMVGLMFRHLVIGYRLRLLRQTYFDLLTVAIPLRHDRLLHLKIQLRDLRHHYRLTCCSTWAGCTALICSLLSMLTMTLRSLIEANALIPIALVFFVLGIGILLVSIGFVWLDFQADDRSLLQEIQWILTNRSIPVTLAAPKLTLPHRVSQRRQSGVNSSASGMD
ncbi:MAG TPA: hypothetical protein V6D10_24400 [Trichocoleus sp.]|jgi:hypothetical protein